MENVERRLAAILTADVAGFSRLMGEDEERTLNALNAHISETFEPSISENNGRIFKTTGDGLLVEFASVIDAVRCAVAIQKAMTETNFNVPEDQKIEFRIGINVGDVIVQHDDIYGDGVNVAARLEGMAQPGGICISRAVRDQIRDKIDYELEDLGEIEAKNIARPVRVFRILHEGAPGISQTDKTPMRRSRVLVAALTGCVILGSSFWWWQGWPERVDPARPDKIEFPLPTKPSIAILPFENLSGDQEQDYFADGFTEDLITNVAQSKELFVIARNSSFTYKGRAVKVRQVSEELGVRFVLEGSIRRVGDNMRITAQLIDATVGAHIWAKRYDKPTAQIFDIQDEVSREIAGTMLVNIRKADLAKAVQKRPADLTAYDFVLRARAAFDKPGKKAKLEARMFAEKAIEIDPLYAAAYAVLGDTFNSAYITQWEGPEALDRAYISARKAVDLDPQLSSAHELLGRIFLRRMQYSEAIVELEKAILLNPNRARHYASLADILTFADRPDEAIKLMQQANRLDPFYPARQTMYLGRAYYFAKRYDEAVNELKNCAARAPRWRACYMFLAPVLAELGMQDASKLAVENLLDIAPKFSISASVQGHLPFVPSAMQFYVNGLRKAGVPH